MRLKLFNRPRYTGELDLVSLLTGVATILGVLFNVPVGF